MEDIKGQPWYFGTISRAECDVLLAEKGMDGDFMIRESETNVSFINFYNFPSMFLNPNNCFPILIIIVLIF